MGFIPSNGFLYAVDLPLSPLGNESTLLIRDDSPGDGYERIL